MYKEILVPIDGLDGTGAALAHASSLAKMYGARITLLAVIGGVSTSPWITDGTGRVFSAALEAEEHRKAYRWKRSAEKASQGIQSIAQRLTTEGIASQQAVLMGKPGPCICKYAREISADLIVMSQSRHSWLRSWFWGTIADDVVVSADISVLLIKAPQ